MKGIMRSPFAKKHLIFALIVFIITCAAGPVYAAPPLRLSPNNLPDGTQYSNYTESLNANGGTPPYFWSSTALPPGLALTPSGATAALSGIPSLTGTFTFTVTLTDSAGGSDTIIYSITIAAGACTFVGSNAGTIDFGPIDPSIGPAFGTVTQQIRFTCPVGKAYTVSQDATGWTLAGADSIPYTPGFIAGGTGLGATAIDLLTPNSQALQANYLNAGAGPYANNNVDTLTIRWSAPAGSITAMLSPGAVRATVISKCMVSQTPGTLSFNIDPMAASTSATIAPDMQIACTKNSGVTITAASACGGLDSSYPPSCGGSLIPYTFNVLPNVTGLGLGIGVSLTIGGSTTSNFYQNAPIGNYGDLQTLTITY